MMSPMDTQRRSPEFEAPAAGEMGLVCAEHGESAEVCRRALVERLQPGYFPVSFLTLTAWEQKCGERDVV